MGMRKMTPPQKRGLCNVFRSVFLRGTNNSKVWDTSNRAINVIINNLKGIFFDDDDFEHMSCSVEASWGKIGMAEIRICDHRELRKSNVFR